MGNPYKLGGYYQITLLCGPPECQSVMEQHQAKEPSIKFYRERPSWTFYRFPILDNYSAALAYRLYLERYLPEDFVEPLRGRDLACWCHLDQPCHADVLLEVANR
jgi:hypothetical protein